MNKPNSISRRGFIKTLSSSALGVGALATFNQSSFAGTGKTSVGKAKNLIFMVSDGMNNGTLSAANHWLNLTENRDSNWTQLYKDRLAVRRLVETNCADSLVTDSAAASSAWGIGKRVNMRSVNVTPEGASPTPLGIFAKEKGKSVGMVTTARITHATPAGFAANVPHRDMESVIAEQYLERKIDVLLGGGDEHFNPEKREDGKDLYSAFSAKGYQVLKSKEELLNKGMSGEALLGVFSEDHIPYWIDRENIEAIGSKTPSLEEMTEIALKRLQKNPTGFLLQVEAGRVDHAGHANDAAAIVTEQLEFDRTIKLVRKFAEANPDTMVIVTTDHGTGGFMLNGADEGYQYTAERFLKLGNCKGSYTMIESHMDSKDPHGTWVRAVESVLNIQLDASEKERLMHALTLPEDKGLYSASKRIAEAIKPIAYNRFSTEWTSYNHTADVVEMAMWGPGAEELPGYIENWELHQVIRDYLAI